MVHKGKKFMYQTPRYVRMPPLSRRRVEGSAGEVKMRAVALTTQLANIRDVTPPHPPPPRVNECTRCCSLHRTRRLRHCQALHLQTLAHGLLSFGRKLVLDQRLLDGFPCCRLGKFNLPHIRT